MPALRILFGFIAFSHDIARVDVTFWNIFSRFYEFMAVYELQNLKNLDTFTVQQYRRLLEKHQIELCSGANKCKHYKIQVNPFTMLTRAC